jgi:hypothetical protein
MVSSCANPSCSAPFRHLKEGRLFVIDPRERTHKVVDRPSSQLEYFWLCERCKPRFTLVVGPGNRVSCVSRVKIERDDRVYALSA